MIKAIKITALLGFIALSMISCTEKPVDRYNSTVEASFDAWMALNYPDIQKADYGVYVQPIVSCDTGSMPKEGDWVKINFTGRLINNAVYTTRYEDVARQIGTFAYTTHFVPQFTYMSEYTITKGELEALKHMKVGERRRLFIPPALAYDKIAASFNKGYAGTSSVYTNAPLIVDMTLEEIISDPSKYEAKKVAEFAQQQWNMSPSDTLLESYYIEKLDSVAGSDKITIDSTVYMYYVGSFLDGFVFDTNIDTVAKRLNIYKSSNSYVPLSYIPKNEGLVGAFFTAFSQMKDTLKYNDHFRMVFTSDYGYGASGSATGATVIQAYDPLTFDVWICPARGISKNPYNIPYLLHALKDTPSDPKEHVYVDGYIVGCVEGTDINTDAKFSGTFTTKSNVLIAEKSSDTIPEKCIAVDLSSNYELQKKYNLVDNAKATSRITFIGDLTNVLGRTGLTNLKTK